jgi:hypothetical protein
MGFAKKDVEGAGDAFEEYYSYTAYYIAISGFA